MNNYKKSFLPNKVPLFTIPIKGAKVTTVLVMFKTGSKYETRENNGISHFLEHMFFKGTKNRLDTLALSSEIDSLGGEYNAFTSKEFTGYWFKVTSNKLPKVFNILSDMLFNSKFEADEIEREKGVIIEELNMYEDNPRMHIEDVFEQCLYGDAPAGWETIGTKENIRRFKREDFIKYFEAQYGAKSAHIIVAGAVKPSDKKMITKFFSGFGNHQYRIKPAVVEKQKTPEIKVFPKKTDQLFLSLGVRTVKIDHADEFKLKLLSIILGGSMSSRLFISLRERNSLAYFVMSTTEFYSDSGYLTTEAGVPIEKINEAVKIILNEYKKISEELIPEKELKKAKDILQGKVALQMEASDNLANWYAQQAIYRKKPVTPGDLVKKIKKISSSELREIAKKYFVNKGLNLAIIGSVDEKKIKPILKF
ncbi:MAG: M16 family metallopeptidase [Patescibacteria group bacterium]